MSGGNSVVRSLTGVSSSFGGRTKATKAGSRCGASPRPPRPGPGCRGARPGGAGSSLTQQQQLDLPGRLLPVVPQVPVDHLAPLHRRLVLGAQRASHLPSDPHGVEKGSKHRINPHETVEAAFTPPRAHAHTHGNTRHAHTPFS